MTHTNDPKLPFGQEKSSVQLNEEPINRSGGENPEGDEHQGVPPGRGKAKKPYKGGRQTQGGVPNPDDVDDKDSPGGFRGLDER
jgi:hypothetical protein